MSRKEPGRTTRLLTTLLLVGFAACVTVGVSTSSLSLDEKIGQLFVYAARGTYMNEQSSDYRELLRQVRENRVGGILWYQSEKVYETAWLDRRLQEAARVPLLIAADLEAGTGMRFEDTTYWPWPMGVAATGDPSFAEREGRAVAAEARALGVNQIYAPVADLNSDPDNPNINVRSFGEDPEDVSRYVAAFVRGVQSAGVLATLKHFPGHGDTHTDSHRALPVLSVSLDRLDRMELVPFRAGIAAGARAVMTAHLSVPALDATPVPVRAEGVRENPYTNDPAEIAASATTPASLSPALTENLLREKLGFQGLVVTDAVDMGALVDHYDAGETAVRAILAGADMIPKSPDTDAAIAAVKQAVVSGRIPRERLDRSIQRILDAKRWAGAPLADPDRIFRDVDGAAHRALAQEIARKSLTLVREETGALPLTRAVRLLVVAVSDVPEKVGADLDRELRARLAEPPQTLSLDSRSTGEDVAAVAEAARRADVVLVCLFVRPRSGRGTIALPAVAKTAFARLADAAPSAKRVVVSFGSPYLLRDLPDARTYLAAYGTQADLQVAVARAIFGEAAITGRLPVTIPGAAERGSGISRPAVPSAKRP